MAFSPLFSTNVRFFENYVRSRVRIHSKPLYSCSQINSTLTCVKHIDAPSRNKGTNRLQNLSGKKTRSANTLKEIDLGQTRQSRQTRQTRLIRLNKINPADERHSKPDIKPTGKYRRKIRFLCIIPGI